MLCKAEIRRRKQQSARDKAKHREEQEERERRLCAVDQSLLAVGILKARIICFDKMLENPLPGQILLILFGSAS